MTIQKIISDGGSGAGQAALDAAIRLGIDYGGWTAEESLRQNGRFRSRYRLKKTPVADYRSQVANNTLFADGTLILSRGAFPTGMGLAVRFAGIYHRPSLHVDLHTSTLTDAARMIASWIKINKVRCLYVTGSSMHEDPAIYADTFHLLLRVFRLTGTRGTAIRSQNADDPTAMGNDDIIEEIIGALPIKERFAIANMDMVDVQAVQQLFDRYVRKEQRAGIVDDESADLIEKLWRKLKMTHTLRVVK